MAEIATLRKRSLSPGLIIHLTIKRATKENAAAYLVQKVANLC